MKKFYIVLTKIHRQILFFFGGKDGKDMSETKNCILPYWDWLFDFTEKIALSKRTYFIIIWY